MSDTKPVKARITITVEVDPDEWTATFDVEGRAAIRADVKKYIGNGVQGYGVFGNGEVSAEINWE